MRGNTQSHREPNLSRRVAAIHSIVILRARYGRGMRAVSGVTEPEDVESLIPAAVEADDITRVDASTGIEIDLDTGICSA